MKTNINSSDNNSEKKRIKIPNVFVITAKGKKSNQISITPPKICPICGRKDVDGEFELKYSRKFITVLMCREHIESTKKAQNPKFLYLTLISIILFIISLPFLHLFINSFIFLIILLAIPIVCVFSIYKAIKTHNYVEFIDDHIEFKYYSEYSIISFKNVEWGYAFKNLNKLSDYILKLELTEDFKKKRNKALKNFGITALISLIGIIFSIYIFKETMFTTIIYVILLIVLCFFLSKVCIYHTEILDGEN